MKPFVLLSCALLLVMSGVASAAMSCCAMDMEQDVMVMQMSDGMGMPCHDMSGDDQQTADCDGCQCQHCTQISVLFDTPSLHCMKINVPYLSMDLAVDSLYPEGPYQPPKQLS